MMKFSLITCALLLSLTGGHAEVGETQPQIEARFRTRVDAAGRECLYQQEDTFLLVSYEQGTSVAEHRFLRSSLERRKGLDVPCPPFPAQTRPIREGIGLYAITFGASGRPSKFNVVHSANGVLDHWTDFYTQKNWRGPLGTTITFAMAYHKNGASRTKLYGA